MPQTERKKDIPRRRVRPLKDNPTPEEVREAYDELRALVEMHEDPTEKQGMEKHHILPGVTKTTGDRINAIVALRVDGFRDVDISELLNMPQPEPHRLERTYPEAFAKAEAHALIAAERKYQVNIWRVRAGLSEYAPKMIKVLAELAENPQTPPTVRRQSAVDILNLTGIGYTRNKSGGKDQQVMAGAKTYIQNIISSTGGDLTLDSVVEDESIEDAEVVDD